LYVLSAVLWQTSRILSPAHVRRRSNRKIKPVNNLGTTQAQEWLPVDPVLIHDNRQSDPDLDLAAVAEAWPKLPEAIKAGILAMVKAAGR
jgi:hypothetical protein